MTETQREALRRAFPDYDLVSGRHRAEIEALFIAGYALGALETLEATHTALLEHGEPSGHVEEE